MRHPYRSLGILAALMLCAANAQSQTAWPTKPVRIITPFPVGSGPEAALRLVAEKLSKTWGKPVIVENKPGANGFGYDPYFATEQLSLTAAELEPSDKNRLSHRGKALARLASRLSARAG